MRAAFASPFGFLIGLSLGALGGGGAILTVPLLVYGAGLDPEAATSVSLLVVGPVAAWGAISHWREGRVRVARGAVVGLAGVGGSLLGSRLSRSVDPDLLLLLFAFLMVFAALATLGRVKRQGTSGLAVDVPLGNGVEAPDSAPEVPRFRGAAWAIRVIVAGTAVGFVTGFFGVGGGFVVVPALVVALGFSMPEAVGTSLLVISINCAVALVPRLEGGDVPWVIVVPLLLAGIAGAGVGNRAVSRVKPRTLAAWFAALILVLAAYTAVTSTIGLVADT